ncbi:MAG: O-antigen ligase family protein, partial [Acidimicrobiales bacterium]
MTSPSSTQSLPRDGDVRWVAGGTVTVPTAELDDLGPISLFLLRMFLLLAPIGMLKGFDTYDPLDGVQRFLFAAPAYAALVLAPRRAIVRIPVSLSLTLLLVWMGLSSLWSIDSAQTLYSLRQDLILAGGLVIAVGLLPVSETYRWFLNGLKLLLLIQIFAVIVDPAARASVEFGQVQDPWRGWMPSKNQLGRFGVLTLTSVLVLDKNLISRIVWSSLALVLIIGSSSATSLGATFVVLLVIFWIRRYQRVGEAWGGVFILASVFMGLIMVILAFASVALIVEALGRDLTFTGRTAVWEAALPLVDDAPWLGYGYEALWTGSTGTSVDLQREIGYGVAHAHNGALDVTLSLGVIGLLLFFGLFMSTLVLSLRHLRTSDYAAWVFMFLILQLIFGAVEATYLG